VRAVLHRGTDAANLPMDLQGHRGVRARSPSSKRNTSVITCTLPNRGARAPPFIEA
jgi:hypothetical protein